MSGMFSSKKTTPEYQTISDPTGGVRGKTLDWLEKQIGTEAKPYTGEMVAPMSSQEKGSFDFLRKYTDQPTAQGTQLANEEIRKTMQNEYDPTTSPYYQSMKAEAARNLEDTTAGIASDAAGGGRYWSGGRIAQQGEARSDMGTALNTLLGQMTQQERQNRLAAVPMAAQLGQEEQQLPLQQATAMQQLGALPRNIEQGLDEATYNEWLRQQSYPLQIAQLAQPYAAQQPTMAQVGYQPSAWSQLLKNVIALYSGWGEQVATVR